MSTGKPETIMESFDKCTTKKHGLVLMLGSVFISPFVIGHIIYKTYKRRKENRHLYQKLEEKNI